MTVDVCDNNFENKITRVVYFCFQSLYNVARIR